MTNGLTVLVACQMASWLDSEKSPWYTRIYEKLRRKKTLVIYSMLIPTIGLQGALSFLLAHPKYKATIASYIGILSYLNLASRERVLFSCLIWRFLVASFSYILESVQR